MREVLEDWFTTYVDPEKDGVRHEITGAGQLGPIRSTGNVDAEFFAGDPWSAGPGGWEGDEGQSRI
jgi:hypothetical protein